jgi:hypothetical protein
VALREIDRASAELQTDGFLLVTNYGGGYLGDPAFEPVFAAPNCLRATVSIHLVNYPAAGPSVIDSALAALSKTQLLTEDELLAVATTRFNPHCATGSRPAGPTEIADRAHRRDPVDRDRCGEVDSPIRAAGHPAEYRSTMSLRAKIVVRAFRCDMEDLLWAKRVRQTHPPRQEVLP